MPQVPTYDNLRIEGKMAPDARLTAFMSDEAAGLGTANMLQSMSAKLVEDERNKADEIATMSAGRQLKEFTTSMMYDPKTGALNRKGKDAMGLPTEVRGAYEQKHNEVRQTLTNDRQRLAFDRMSNSLALETNLTVQRHVAHQIEAYDNTETESAIGTARDAAISNFTNLDRIALEAGSIRENIRLYAARNGRGAEWVKAKTDTEISKLHMGVIDRMLTADQDKAAKSYFNLYKTEITGEDVTKTEKMLEAGTLKGDSQRQADDILGKAKTRTEASDLLKEITDPKLREATTHLVDVGFNRKKQAEQESERADLDEATQIVEKTGSFGAIPAPLLARLSLSSRSALRAYAQQRSSGTEAKTDLTLYYDLMSQASSPELRNKFLKTNLTEYKSKLSPGDFKHLVEIQTGMRNKDQTTEDKITGYRTANQIVESTLHTIYGKIKPDSDEGKKADLFRRTVDDQIELFKRQNGGRTPSSKDVQQIVDDLIIKGKVRGGGFAGIFDANRRLFELAPSEVGQFKVTSIDDIPKQARTEIEAELQRRQMPVTPQNIMDAYVIGVTTRIQRGR